MLVFSADDFGKSEIANKNILKLARLGKVQRVSVMVNGIISGEEAKKLLNSRVNLDIHLELPHLSSLGNAVAIPAKTGIRKKSSVFWIPVQGRDDKKGVFSRSSWFILLFLINHTSTKKIEQLWDSQIKKFVNLFNKTPDGLNSHEHVHFFPPYFRIALKLCEKYKIKHIRFGEKGVIVRRNIIGWILSVLNWYNKRLMAYSLKLKAYAWLTSLDWIKDLDSFISDNNSNNTLEIVCHSEIKKEFKELMGRRE